jgi:hypothetical protein
MFRERSMRSLLRSAGLCLGLAASLVAWPAEFVAAPAKALPAGWFRLVGTAPDDFGGNALRAMDVLKGDKVFGGVRLAATIGRSDNQLWKERFPINGTNDVVRLENKLTGQCLADAVGDSIAATLRPCNDERTQWQKIVMGGNRVAFRRTTEIIGVTPNISICLSKDFRVPEELVVHPCNDIVQDVMIWEARSVPGE